MVRDIDLTLEGVMLKKKKKKTGGVHSQSILTTSQNKPKHITSLRWLNWYQIHVKVNPRSINEKETINPK